MNVIYVIYGVLAIEEALGKRIKKEGKNGRIA
jgi:hypothetical protein